LRRAAFAIFIVGEHGDVAGREAGESNEGAAHNMARMMHSCSKPSAQYLFGRCFFILSKGSANVSLLPQNFQE